MARLILPKPVVILVAFIICSLRPVDKIGDPPSVNTREAVKATDAVGGPVVQPTNPRETRLPVVVLGSALSDRCGSGSVPIERQAV
jgi:hypothetical protein